MTVRVAASQPATLRLGGRRYAVGRKPVTLRVSIGAAKALRGELSAIGKKTRLTIALPRR